MKKRKIIGWDSVVLLDWILDTSGENASRLPAIESVVAGVDNGYCRLVVSTLIYVEVLANNNPKGFIKKFERFMADSKKVKIISVDVGVAQKAQEIRNRMKSIKTPDAVHVATAIVGKADVFHTFDKQLLSLDGKKVVDGLRILPCEIPGATVSIPQS